LGIGAAGGKSSAKEGKMLAARLETLRKERANRTPTPPLSAVNAVNAKEKQPMVVGAGPSGSNQPMMMDPVSAESSSTKSNGGGSKRKNRRKKGKR
jgi:hypothetical protein